MALQTNQFKMSSTKGTPISGNNTITYRFWDADPTATLQSGDWVKVVTSPDTNPQVTSVGKATLASDAIIGMVNTNPMKEIFNVLDYVEVSQNENLSLTEAGAAFAAGTLLEVDVTSSKVVPNTTGTKVAKAQEGATADGDLIRIRILTENK